MLVSAKYSRAIADTVLAAVKPPVTDHGQSGSVKQLAQGSASRARFQSSLTNCGPDGTDPHLSPQSRETAHGKVGSVGRTSGLTSTCD